MLIENFRESFLSRTPAAQMGLCGIYIDLCISKAIILFISRYIFSRMLTWTTRHQQVCLQLSLAVRFCLSNRAKRCDLHIFSSITRLAFCIHMDLGMKKLMKIIRTDKAHLQHLTTALAVWELRFRLSRLHHSINDPYHHKCNQCRTISIESTCSSSFSRHLIATETFRCRWQANFRQLVK